MKLAEALIQRADLQRQLSAMSARLSANAKVQEGDEPSEDIVALLKHLDELTDSYESYIRRINKTNNLTITDGKSLTDMIAKRDAMTCKIKILQDLADSASDKINRYSNNEIKIVSTVNVSELRTKIDKLSKALRELDTKIQSINWLTELSD